MHYGCIINVWLCVIIVFSDLYVHLERFHVGVLVGFIEKTLSELWGKIRPLLFVYIRYYGLEYVVEMFL
jgi:hypothetical protein